MGQGAAVKYWEIIADNLSSLNEGAIMKFM
jgi:hypothetical protein